MLIDCDLVTYASVNCVIIGLVNGLAPKGPRRLEQTWANVDLSLIRISEHIFSEIWIKMEN